MSATTKMMHNPPHPGEVLKLYVDATNKTIGEVAEALGINRKTLSLILNGHASVTAEMALRFSAAFGTTAQFWLNQQKSYDLWQATQKVDVSRISPLIAA